MLAIASYMVGNVNFSIIISRFKNRDITKVGSGNPGTMNMSRAFGIKIGMLILFLDIVKGALPTLASRLIFADTYFGNSTLEVVIIAQYVAGFFTVAVEDVESERDREEIKQVADLYISSNDSFDIFWSAKR